MKKITGFFLIISMMASMFAAVVVDTTLPADRFNMIIEAQTQNGTIGLIKNFNIEAYSTVDQLVDANSKIIVFRNLLQGLDVSQDEVLAGKVQEYVSLCNSISDQIKAKIEALQAASGSSGQVVAYTGGPVFSTAGSTSTSEVKPTVQPKEIPYYNLISGFLQLRDLGAVSNNPEELRGLAEKMYTIYQEVAAFKIRAESVQGSLKRLYDDLMQGQVASWTEDAVVYQTRLSDDDFKNLLSEMAILEALAGTLSDAQAYVMPIKKAQALVIAFSQYIQVIDQAYVSLKQKIKTMSESAGGTQVVSPVTAVADTSAVESRSADDVRLDELQKMFETEVLSYDTLNKMLSELQGMKSRINELLTVARLTEEGLAKIKDTLSRCDGLILRIQDRIASIDPTQAALPMNAAPGSPEMYTTTVMKTAVVPLTIEDVKQILQDVRGQLMATYEKRKSLAPADALQQVQVQYDRLVELESQTQDPEMLRYVADYKSFAEKLQSQFKVQADYVRITEIVEQIKGLREQINKAATAEMYDQIVSGLQAQKEALRAIDTDHAKLQEYIQKYVSYCDSLIGYLAKVQIKAVVQVIVGIRQNIAGFSSQQDYENAFKVLAEQKAKLLAAQVADTQWKNYIQAYAQYCDRLVAYLQQHLQYGLVRPLVEKVKSIWNNIKNLDVAVILQQAAEQKAALLALQVTDEKLKRVIESYVEYCDRLIAYAQRESVIVALKEVVENLKSIRQEVDLLVMAARQTNSANAETILAMCATRMQQINAQRSRLMSLKTTDNGLQKHIENYVAYCDRLFEKVAEVKAQFTKAEQQAPTARYQALQEKLNNIKEQIVGTVKLVKEGAQFFAEPFGTIRASINAIKDGLEADEQLLASEKQDLAQVCEELFVFMEEQSAAAYAFVAEQNEAKKEIAGNETQAASIPVEVSRYETLAAVLGEMVPGVVALQSVDACNAMIANLEARKESFASEVNLSDVERVKLIEQVNGLIERVNAKKQILLEANQEETVSVSYPDEARVASTATRYEMLNALSMDLEYSVEALHDDLTNVEAFDAMVAKINDRIKSLDEESSLSDSEKSMLMSRYNMLLDRVAAIRAGGTTKRAVAMA